MDSLVLCLSPKKLTSKNSSDPSFGQPLTLGRIKINREGLVDENEWEDEEIRLKEPVEEHLEEPVDLIRGFDEGRFSISIESWYDMTLAWFKKYLDTIREDQKPHFFLMNRELKDLLRVFYCRSKFLVMKFEGIIYIQKLVEETHNNRNRTLASGFTRKPRRELYRGLKLRNHLLKDPHPDHEINDKERRLTILKTQFAEHRLVYGVRVDAVTASGQFVDISQEGMSSTSDGQYPFVLLDVWSECLIKGSKRILGIRQESQLVQIKYLKAMEEILKGSVFKGDDHQEWEPKLCISSCHQILQDLKQNVTKEKIVYELSPISKTKNRSIKKPITADFKMNLKESSEKPSFLPSWFLGENP
jgi:hypothetical protein